jgi:hypothetical protein
MFELCQKCVAGAGLSDQGLRALSGNNERQSFTSVSRRPVKQRLRVSTDVDQGPASRIGPQGLPFIDMSRTLKQSRRGLDMRPDEMMTVPRGIRPAGEKGTR